LRDQDIKALFDRRASGFDEGWARTAPIGAGMHFMLEAMFGGLAPDARLTARSRIAHRASRIADPPDGPIGSTLSRHGARMRRPRGILPETASGLLPCPTKSRYLQRDGEVAEWSKALPC
jgi:hypothetical protein